MMMVQKDAFEELTGLQWVRSGGKATCHGQWHLMIDGEHKGTVFHCGHPTANYPYYGQLVGTDTMRLAPNGRGFRLLKDAQADLLAAAGI